MSDDLEIMRGTGNVFADFGDRVPIGTKPNPTGC